MLNLFMFQFQQILSELIKIVFLIIILIGFSPMIHLVHNYYRYGYCLPNRGLHRIAICCLFLQKLIASKWMHHLTELRTCHSSYMVGHRLYRYCRICFCRLMLDSWLNPHFLLFQALRGSIDLPPWVSSIASALSLGTICWLILHNLSIQFGFGQEISHAKSCQRA